MGVQTPIAITGAKMSNKIETQSEIKTTAKTAASPSKVRGRPLGAKNADPNRSRRVNITLSPAQEAEALRIGGGKLSAGIQQIGRAHV